MSSENGGLDDVIMNDCHVGVKESKCFFLDDFFNVQEGFKAVVTKVRKALADVGRIID